MERYHVVPNGDLREHVCSGYQCWCKPVPDAEDDNIVVHNAMDQRELYEDGERKLN